MEQQDILKSALTEITLADGFRRFDCHSIGIGPKEVGGKATDDLVIQFYVVCKQPTRNIPMERRIPGSIRVTLVESEQDLSVDTDVIESPAPEVYSPVPGAVLRPVPGGARIWNTGLTDAGTLGGWVWDKTDESIVFLSNQHVLGTTVNTPIHQPNSASENRIGFVKRWAASPVLVPQDELTPADCNLADAAIGGVDETSFLDLNVLSVGPAIFEIDPATLFMVVEKYGQVSGLKQGSVTQTTDLNSVVDFKNGLGDYLICDSFRVRPLDNDDHFSTQGDSGSIVFRREDDRNAAVGLLWGGGGSSTQQNQYSLCSKIHNVFNVLDLDVLCGGGFTAFLDALFDNQPGDSPRARVASLFSARRDLGRPQRFSRGLARSVQERMRRSKNGSTIVDMLQDHRAEALTLLIRTGDVRRAAINALSPILAGTSTVNELFEKRLCDDDETRIALFLDEVERRGSKSLRRSTNKLRKLLAAASGKTVSELF